MSFAENSSELKGDGLVSTNVNHLTEIRFEEMQQRGDLGSTCGLRVVVGDVSNRHIVDIQHVSRLLLDRIDQHVQLSTFPETRVGRIILRRLSPHHAKKEKVNDVRMNQNP